MMPNARSIRLFVLPQEPQPGLSTSWLVISYNHNASTLPSLWNIPNSCLLLPSIIETKKVSLKDSNFSLIIMNFVMHTPSSMILLSKRICSCSRSNKKKKAMINQCSMTRHSSMLSSMPSPPLLAGA